MLSISLKSKRYIMDNNDVVNSTFIEINLHSPDLWDLINIIMFTNYTTNKCLKATVYLIVHNLTFFEQLLKNLKSPTGQDFGDRSFVFGRGFNWKIDSEKDFE